MPGSSRPEVEQMYALGTTVALLQDIAPFEVPAAAGQGKHLTITLCYNE